MLDISFYPTNGEPAYSVEVAENFYGWLAKSDFSKIGKSVPRKIKIEGEEEKLPLVQLGKDNRRKLRTFLGEEIIRESDAILTQLGDSPSKKEYQDATYRLRKLQELRKCVENENYQYLQRV
ncbi:hypothetical protein NDI37_15020 [Funiculus sociatus GB2-A5]|uniref:LAGLIDADG homing endonuclease n=1 Tax=Funiculus sociatus GB2-A5 TaxID=2933946 RepID=A0ABV0JRQ1_9CYAN|nr:MULTISPECIES: hypothetical protein [unclassified Trichocoleus]MBD1908153.1 hypothetical protein [Trichocoleus sp. FACHB-832]MBD2062016.1 hypothetical protein [Trichocoleus sp. FACHB-6]